MNMKTPTDFALMAKIAVGIVKQCYTLKAVKSQSINSILS